MRHTRIFGTAKQNARLSQRFKIIAGVPSATSTIHRRDIDVGLRKSSTLSDGCRWREEDLSNGDGQWKNMI